jgi:integrase
LSSIAEEVAAKFLATARRTAGRASPVFILLARTGMRLREALALQWKDLDFGAREICVARAFSAGRRAWRPAR